MNLQEWQAILLAYGVLLVLAETELGPLASLMAWGIAVTYFVDANVSQGNLISSLFADPVSKVAAATAQIPNQGMGSANVSGSNATILPSGQVVAGP